MDIAGLYAGLGQALKDVLEVSPLITMLVLIASFQVLVRVGWCILQRVGPLLVAMYLLLVTSGRVTASTYLAAFEKLQ